MLADVNTYDIMNADVLVFTESAVNIFSDDQVGSEA
jgi:ribosomal protein L4